MGGEKGNKEVHFTVKNHHNYFKPFLKDTIISFNKEFDISEETGTRTVSDVRNKIKQENCIFFCTS